MLKAVSRLALCALCILSPGLQARADTSSLGHNTRLEYRFTDRPFVELLGFMEAPDGYDEITNYAKVQPIKPISTMTIAEVLDYQRLLRQKGSKSSAVGRYQFIYKTLLARVQQYGIDENRLFNKEIQDHLARQEMAQCGFYDIEKDVGELGDCLAGVWAALPLLTGSERGRSRYEDMQINAALTSPEVIEAVLRARYHIYAPQTYKAKTSGFHVSQSSYLTDGSTPVVINGYKSSR